MASGVLDIQSRSFTSNGTATFIYTPRGGSRIAVYTRPVAGSNGTVAIFRRPQGGAADVALGSGGAVAVTGGAEDQQLCDFPVAGQVVIVFTNNNATAGTVTCEVAEG